MVFGIVCQSGPPFPFYPIRMSCHFERVASPTADVVRGLGHIKIEMALCRL